MVNKYIVRSRISEKKFREIIRLFALDIEGTKIASITGVSDHKDLESVLLSFVRQTVPLIQGKSKLMKASLELDEYVGNVVVVHEENILFLVS